MEHKITYHKGRDPRCHIARCVCGWAYSNTRNAIRDRAQMHAEHFTKWNELCAWNDPNRLTVMPMNEFI